MYLLSQYNMFLTNHDIYFKGAFVVDFMSIIVMAFIAYIGYSYYKLSKRKTFFVFTWAFSTLSLAYLIQLFVNLSIHYDFFNTSLIGIVESVYLANSSIHIFQLIAIFIFRFLLLGGLYLLYQTFHERNMFDHSIMAFLLLAVSYLSITNYKLFHLIIFLFLCFVALSYHKKYLENKNGLTLMLSFCFIFLSISQIGFLVVNPTWFVYAISGLIQFMGLFLLLTTLVLLKHGKKK